MVAYSFYETDNRVRRYAETLAKRGDLVDAIALRRPGQPAFEVLKGVNVYRIQERLIDEKGPVSYLIKLAAFFLRSAWVLIARHMRSPYSVIHVHSVPDFQVFAALIPKLMGARIILDVHDIVPEFYASKFKVRERSLVFRILLLTEKISCAFSDHVIIANHLWYEKITRRSVKPEKCTAIINYPDPSIFRPRARTKESNGDFVLLYPGTLNEHQGVDLAIRAVAKLRDDVPNLKFLIMGKGPDWEKLAEMVRNEDLGDRVSMLELVPLEEIAETMANVDLGVVPKRKDSFGNEAFSTKIMEFMAMGVPTVVANTRIDEYYFNDEVVQFFESGDSEDLAATILNLVRNPERRKVLHENGIKFVQANSWNVKKADYLGLVDRLSEPKRSRTSQVALGVEQQRELRNRRSTTFDCIQPAETVGQMLADRYRFPESADQFSVTGDLSETSGYFRIGPDLICYGSCSSKTPAHAITDRLPDIQEDIRVSASNVEIPFDPIEVVDTLRSERYFSRDGSGGEHALPMNKVFRKLYYAVRPLMPVPVRKHFQRVYLLNRSKKSFPAWPVDCTVEKIFEQLLILSMKSRGVSRIPFIWFWPDGLPGATIVTHDVETSAGVAFCSRLMDLNDSFGIKTSFQIVPEKRYAVAESVLHEIRSRGFEINVHDLNHDGHLFKNREVFFRRAERINEYAGKFGARGFRSAVMYRNVHWYNALKVSYDMSIPNSAHLDPQHGGCCTVLPFFVGDIVELPVTMVQDYSLFHVLQEYSITFWKQQISMVRQRHGLASFIVHPDYIAGQKEWGIYAELLTYLSELRSQGRTWIALPGEVADWWRLRSRLNLVEAGNTWRIEGKGSERARLAFAVLENDTLTYEIARAEDVLRSVGVSQMRT